jgi:CDP-glucose 4,6-dehydratase
MTRYRVTEIWRGRSVLVTGNTGFKGAWLSLWLQQLGARVSGIALPPIGTPNLYELVGSWDGQEHFVVDLRDPGAVKAAIDRIRPQIVFHLAAQALVRASYRDPVETYATNLMGTLHLLDAIRAQPSIEAVIVVTTDKVYENDSRGVLFVEGDRLGGKDPYSNSKACVELVVQSYRDSFLSHGRGPTVVTARAGNVVGGGDWSEDRLVPDVVRALAAGHSVSLRYPDSVRPWQHVLEPLRGYLMLAERLLTEPESAPPALNFGPDPKSFLTVAQVVDTLSHAFANAVHWEQASGPHPSEATALTLDSSLAKRALGWVPILSMKETIDWTADWYGRWIKGDDPRRLVLDQIARYELRCREERPD